MSVDDGIQRFWTWWQTAQERVVHAIEVEQAFDDDLVRDISDHVDAIGELDWELCPGRTAKHAFCLSSRGVPEARLLTERWRHRGPSPDGTWEYFAARQGDQASTIVFDEVPFAPDDLRVTFELDAGRERMDVTCFHPHFTQLRDEQHATALYLLLDRALGEDAVERWFGHVSATPTETKDAVPFGKLREALADLERTATAEKFVLLKGESDVGAPIFMLCNRALKRIDHLLDTMHVAVDLSILEKNPAGLTTSAEAEELNELEDELMRALGGLVVYFGRETKPGHRVMHWYAPEDSAAYAIIERWTQQHPEHDPRVEWMCDPKWEFVKRYA